MKDLSTKNVIVKEEKESSESENESKSSGSDNEENAVAIEPIKAVVYDDVKMKLMKKYSEIVSKKNKSFRRRHDNYERFSYKRCGC